MKYAVPEGKRDYHDDRAAELLAHEAALFIAEEASGRSLITVMRAILSSRGDRATIFVSVFPDTEAVSALSFLERQREAFSDRLKQRTRLKPLPRIDFALHDGSPGH